MFECEHCGARTHLCKVTINRTWAIQKTEYILCERCIQKIEAFINHQARIIRKKPDNSMRLESFM